MWKPSDNGITLLALAGQRPPTTILYAAFNPGMVKLPPREAALVRQVFPTAQYLGAARIKDNQCGLLKRVRQARFEFVSRARKFSVFFVMDAKFAVVGEVELGGAVDESRASDIRLDLLPSGIVASFMLYHPTAWNARAVRLSVTREGTAVAVSFSDPPDIPGLETRLQNKGRNYGFLVRNGAVFRVDWPAHPLAVTAPASNTATPATPTDLPRRHLMGGVIIKSPMPKLVSTKLHNNGSPLRLGGSDSGTLLQVGHIHGGGRYWPMSEKIIHHTKYGSMYAHYFILAEAAPPWRVTAQSEAWCLPALDNPALCETIQFVSALLLSEDGTEIIIGYGVNDCDSRVLQLPLADVLAFVRRGNVTVGPALNNN